MFRAPLPVPCPCSTRSPPPPERDRRATAGAERDAERIALVGVVLVPFAGIAVLWFIAVIRNLIGEREDWFFATVFLGSGLLFVAMRLVAAGWAVPCSRR